MLLGDAKAERRPASICISLPRRKVGNELAVAAARYGFSHALGFRRAIGKHAFTLRLGDKEGDWPSSFGVCAGGHIAQIGRTSTVP